VITKVPHRRLFIFAALFAIVSFVSIGIAVSNLEAVVSGAVSTFTILFWASSGVVSGFLGIVLAVIALVQSRSVVKSGQ
jgi:hypothetical protein